MSAVDLQFQLLPAEHIARAHGIEKEGFPPDEAASISAFRERQSQAPDLFLGAYAGLPAPATLIGYVCATRSTAESLTHTSMSHHEPSGMSVCIHAVCVDAPYRRKGIATHLLQEYARRLSEDPSTHQLLLIAHEDLVQLYEKAGFEYRGKSPIVHGARPWFELRWVLRQGSSSISPAIIEALSQQSEPKPKVDFDQINSEGFESGTSSNPHDLLCPRPGCGSVILKKGVGKFRLESCIVDLDPLNAQHASLPPIPLSTEAPWWLITPSPMEFENISFSRPTEGGNTGKPIKFLACADCELGPLGWCYAGSPEFWLAATRIAYRSS